MNENILKSDPDVEILVNTTCCIEISTYNDLLVNFKYLV